MWGAMAAFLLCADAAGQGPFTCTSNSAVTPTMRAEGYTERTGDIVLICSGGAPPPSGTILPTTNFTLFLNTAVTSRIQDVTTDASEALLVIDEAGSTESFAPATQLACGTPLTGCSITSNGAEPYDGTPGHPNVFEGIVSENTVTFYGVPIQPPANGNPRVFRFTNIRVDANGITAGGATPGEVFASISVSSGLTLMNSTLTVGFVSQGLLYHTRDATDTVALSGAAALSPCTAGTPCRVATVRFSENFATAFLTQSLSAQQNIPGIIYNSESGFFNTALAASNPNLATAGVADAGTRFNADFQGLPAGAQLWVGLNPLGSSASLQAVLTTAETGPLSPIASGGLMGGLPAAQLSVTSGSATAVWEVTASNPAVIDTFDFPVWVVFPAFSTPSGMLTITGALAPNPDSGAFNSAAGATAQGSSVPIPRFAFSGPTPPAPTAVSVSPSSGSGASQTFALQYADSLGATDLTSVWVWITSNFNAALPSCLLEYATAANQLYLYNDAGTGWLAPATPGAAGTLSNSQCSINMAAATVTTSGTNLTLNLPVTFTAAYAGAKTTYMYAGGSSANSGWQTMGSWTVPATGGPPTTVSVTPSSGSGPQLTFAFEYADPLGATDLTSVWVWITANFNPALPSCLLEYATAANQLYLYNDAGTGWLPPATPGAAGTLSNSQCSINMAAATVTTSGTNLTLYLPVTFTAAYAGAKTTYMYAGGSSANSGWQTMGSWTVPATSAPPTTVSVTPASGSGLQQTFALQYADPLGATDLTSVWVWITANFNPALPSCLLEYGRAANQLYLYNDAGTGWLAPATPGAAGTLSNSQCSINMAAATVTTSGTNLTLNLPVTFTASYAGAKTTYMYAGGSSANSGWQTMGSWTVPATSGPPTTVSVTPSSGSGIQQTFALQYADPLGATDLTSAWVWITANFNPALPSCLLEYARAANQLYLYNDAGTGWLAPATPGAAGTLSNSQCSINMAAATVTTSGTNLTLNLPVTFTTAYAGAKTTYMYAGGSSANSGWQTMGSWTVPATSGPPTTVSVTPSSGSGPQLTFAFEYADPLGATDLTSVWVWITANFNPALPSCLLEYATAANQLYLYNDAGTGWLAPATPGAAGTLSNSQCSINMAAATVTASGTDLTLYLPVTFTTAYAGAKTTYMYAGGSSANSGWQTMGSWNP
jgi:uncharacterized membrane protein